MFVTLKGMKYFYSHIYLEIFKDYCKHMINTFLKYVGMH